MALRAILPALSERLLQIIVTLLFIANAINIGADLSAMADASKLLIGGPGFLYVAVFAAVCVGRHRVDELRPLRHGLEMADLELAL